MAFTHSDIQTNGINVHIVEAGEGPLVVFCHGFPESWYSWRHQLAALADTGYRAVAMDMRGYGQTSSPADVGAFTLSHHIGDVLGVINSLGEANAVVVGHDWGGPVAWYSALMRPDIIRAVAVLSTPYRPPSGALPEGVTPTGLMRKAAGDRDFYRLYFQEPGRAEPEHEANLRRTVEGYLYTFSGDIVADGIVAECWQGYFPTGETMVQQLVVPDSLPRWLTSDDIDYYVSRFSLSGYRGGMNWYRNADSIPQILAPFVGSTVGQPAMFMAGDLDLITPMGPWEPHIAAMQAELPDLRFCELVEGAGHWLQQERSALVNDRLVRFLASLGDV